MVIHYTSLMERISHTVEKGTRSEKRTDSEVLFTKDTCFYYFYFSYELKFLEYRRFYIFNKFVIFCLKFRVLSYFPHGAETLLDLHIYYRSKNITFQRKILHRKLHIHTFIFYRYIIHILQVNIIQF